VPPAAYTRAMHMTGARTRGLASQEAALRALRLFTQPPHRPRIPYAR
jgi:hypothetical protein